jgi:hypothetical protein
VKGVLKGTLYQGKTINKLWSVQMKDGQYSENSSLLVEVIMPIILTRSKVFKRDWH